MEESKTAKTDENAASIDSQVKRVLTTFDVLYSQIMELKILEPYDETDLEFNRNIDSANMQMMGVGLALNQLEKVKGN